MECISGASGLPEQSWKTGDIHSVSYLILITAACGQPSMPHPHACFVDCGLPEIAAATLQYFTAV